MLGDETIDDLENVGKLKIKENLTLNHPKKFMKVFVDSTSNVIFRVDLSTMSTVSTHKQSHAEPSCTRNTSLLFKSYIKISYS